MVEEKKPAKGEQPKAKMVPEADIIRFKKGSETREKRLTVELVEIKEQLAHAQTELKVAKLDTEDEGEINKVKAYLLNRETELLEQEKQNRADRAKVDEDLASLTEREKEARVTTLASEHQVDIDAIKDAEDPEKEALRLKAERLTKEKEEAEKAPESVYESGTPGSVKTPIWDKSQEEFDKDWEQKKREASSR